MKLFYCLPFILLASCKSIETHYKERNYSKVVDIALAQMKRTKEKDKFRKLLNSSLNYLYYGTWTIRDSIETMPIIKKEKYYAAIQKLEKLYHRSAAYLNEEENRNKYSLMSDVVWTKNHIIDTYFDLGQYKLRRALDEDDKSIAQRAHQDFLKIKTKYKAQRPGLDSFTSLALEKATLFIAINTRANFQFQAEVLGLVGRHFKNGNYYQIFLNNEPGKCDCIVNLDFDAPYERNYEHTDSKTYSADVEVGFTCTRDTSGNVIRTAVYERKTAWLTISKVDYECSANLNVGIVGKTKHCTMAGHRFHSHRSDSECSMSTSGYTDIIPSCDKTCSFSSYVSTSSLRSSVFDDLICSANKFYFR